MIDKRIYWFHQASIVCYQRCLKLFFSQSFRFSLPRTAQHFAYNLATIGSWIFLLFQRHHHNLYEPAFPHWMNSADRHRVSHAFRSHRKYYEKIDAALSIKPCATSPSAWRLSEAMVKFNRFAIRFAKIARTSLGVIVVAHQIPCYSSTNHFISQWAFLAWINDPSTRETQRRFGLMQEKHIRA